MDTKMTAFVTSSILGFFCSRSTQMRYELWTHNSYIFVTSKRVAYSVGCTWNSITLETAEHEKHSFQLLHLAVKMSILKLFTCTWEQFNLVKSQNSPDNHTRNDHFSVCASPFLHLTSDHHHALSMCSCGTDLVPNSSADPFFNNSRAHIFLLANTSFIQVTCITHLTLIYVSSHCCQIVFTSEFVTESNWTLKSNLWGMHIKRQIQISLHVHTTQIYPDDKIWCGWHCLQWKIIGMSQHVTSVIMNDVWKRKVTAEDRSIM